MFTKDNNHRDNNNLGPKPSTQSVDRFGRRTHTGAPDKTRRSKVRLRTGRPSYRPEVGVGGLELVVETKITERRVYSSHPRTCECTYEPQSIPRETSKVLSVEDRSTGLTGGEGRGPYDHNGVTGRWIERRWWRRKEVSVRHQCKDNSTQRVLKV